MKPADFKQVCLELPGTEQNPHFDRSAFKVTGKRIFASLHEPSQSANLLLSLPEQQTFCDFGQGIYVVPNKFGLKGWTTFELEKVPDELIREGLLSAYDFLMKGSKS